MKLLLDTNVVVWLLLGAREAIPSAVAERIADVDIDSLVSAASVWEIATKRSLGKLDIDPRWREVLNRLDIGQLPVSAEHAAGVEALPWHHRDPFDRLLVAQAMVEGCVLVTADRTLDQYDVQTLWG